VIHQFINSDRLRGSYLFALAFLSILLPALCLAQAPPPYTISTFAGTCTASGATPPCLGGYSGDGGAATAAVLNGPFDVIFDSSGNLYISDTNNQRVREVSASGGAISTVAGNGTAGFAGDGTSATASGTELNSPSGLTFDSHGNLFIGDSDNFVVREVAGGTISTVAGKNVGVPFAGDLGPATSAGLSNPSGVAVDPSGNIYIADPFNNVVRVVCETQAPIACTNTAFAGYTFAVGDINTFAGNNASGAGYTGDGGPATGALVNNPNAVVLDAAGNLYISDTGNNAIRKVTPDGTITTVAGNGNPQGTYSGDGGKATQAGLNNPKGIAIDSNGNLYIADTDNSVIRMVEPNGIITTIAGNHILGPGYAGDGGAATSAQLYFPSGVAVNGGKVYVADNGNNVIRLLTPAPAIPQIGAGGVITASAFGASTTVSPGSWIEIYGTNLAGDTRGWGPADFNGATAPTSLDLTSVTVGGQSAFVAYISPGQVNVQVPSNVTAGPQPLILKTQFSASAAYNVTVGSAPGVWAPSSLNIGGKQYVGAFLGNSSTLVQPSQPALPGDTIVLWGVGFGTVNPSIPAGQLPQGEATTLTAPVQILFGTTPATVNYQGLAPDLVGVYQFNVVVPAVSANSAVPLTFMQGGAALPQTLYTAVGN
jgi:uncharacterized protein (TIGR03437 family)